MKGWITVHLQQPHLLGPNKDMVSPKTQTLMLILSTDPESQTHIPHLKVLIHHEVATNQVKEAQAAI